jgi:hypothetical protein
VNGGDAAEISTAHCVRMGRINSTGDPHRPEPRPGKPPDPDQAWKLLGLIEDLIRHAESKAGATLAAAGVSAGVLYNLLKDERHPSVGLITVAGLCGALIVVSGLSAILALVPRLDVAGGLERAHLRFRGPAPAAEPDGRQDPTSQLFFRDIARKYKTSDGPTYADALVALTRERAQLTRQIGLQVHANAHIARRKFRWSAWALCALGGDLALLAFTAAIVALG